MLLLISAYEHSFFFFFTLLVIHKHINSTVRGEYSSQVFFYFIQLIAFIGTNQGWNGKRNDTLMTGKIQFSST
jgi:hypothetical protein